MGMATQLESCNFAATEVHARRLTDAALAWTIADCLAAAKIHDEMDRQGIPNNFGKYWDQYLTYCQETARRARKAGDRALLADLGLSADGSQPVG